MNNNYDFFTTPDGRLRTVPRKMELKKNTSNIARISIAALFLFILIVVIAEALFIFAKFKGAT